MYIRVRTACERVYSGRNRPRSEAYVASELSSPEAWQRASGIHKQVVHGCRQLVS